MRVVARQFLIMSVLVANQIQSTGRESVHPAVRGVDVKEFSSMSRFMSFGQMCHCILTVNRRLSAFNVNR